MQAPVGMPMASLGGAASTCTSRVACLLPSATEIMGALGLRAAVVAVTHECDLCPDEVRNLGNVHNIIMSGARM